MRVHSYVKTIFAVFLLLGVVLASFLVTINASALERHAFVVENFTVKDTLGLTILKTSLSATWNYDESLKKVTWYQDPPSYSVTKASWLFIVYSRKTQCAIPKNNNLYITFAGQGEYNVGFSTPWGGFGFKLYKFHSIIDGWYNGKYVKFSAMGDGPCP